MKLLHYTEVLFKTVLKPLVFFALISLPFYLVLNFIDGGRELSRRDEANLRSVWINHTLNDADYGIHGQLNDNTPALFKPFIKQGFVAQCVQVVGINNVTRPDYFRIDGVVTFKDVRKSPKYGDVSVPFVSVYKQTLSGLLGISDVYDVKNTVQAFEPVKTYLPYTGILPEDYIPLNETEYPDLKAPAYLVKQNGECPDAREVSYVKSEKAYKPMAVLKPFDETSAIVWIGALNPNVYRSEKEKEDFRKSEIIRRREERERARKIAMGGIFESFGRMLKKSFSQPDE